MTERKASSVGAATKQKTAQNFADKTPKLIFKRANGNKPKTVRPPTDFKSMAWYAVAAKSISIVATREE
jgi:hypothetical protein